MADGRYLENWKNRDISLTVWPIIANFGIVDAFWPSPSLSTVKVFKNPRWKTAAILKIENRNFIGDGITDRRKYWYDDAHCPFPS